MSSHLTWSYASSLNSSQLFELRICREVTVHAMPSATRERSRMGISRSGSRTERSRLERLERQREDSRSWDRFQSPEPRSQEEMREWMSRWGDPGREGMTRYKLA